MEFQWLGWGPAIALVVVSLFISGLLYLLYRAMQIISKSYEQKFQSRIAKPVFSVMAYSLIWMTFKQLILFKFIVLTNPFLRDYLEIIFNLAYVVLVFVVLFKVLNDSQKELDHRKEKSRIEFEALEARMKAKERDL
ncbi:hypothetical protein MUB04_15720 [Acinetobacter indicus]|uniref:hypothetical protein n=1 Tax=Acinetobacter TaxID=469 RepID=UPI0015D426A3|nr:MULTISPECIES: hypothetical protein [Acinetobacter]MCP0917986.1 hypothetical protein [Acinetobacter indicus]